MPSYPHIYLYYAEKQRLIDYGGSDNEQSIRRAFALYFEALPDVVLEVRPELGSTCLSKVSSAPLDTENGTTTRSISEWLASR